MKELFNHSLEANLLASLMSISDSFEKIEDFTIAADFAHTGHRAIFESITELHKVGKPYDAVLVADNLLGKGLLAEIGGEQKLMNLLSESAVSVFNIVEYANRLKSLRLRRDTEAVLELCKGMVYEDTSTPTESILSDCVARIEKLNSIASKDCVVTDHSTAMMRMLEMAMSTASSGTQTGFIELDNKLGGIRGGQMIVVAARPAMGKSLLAANIADFCSTPDKPWLFFQMEMKEEAMMNRIVASRARVPMNVVRTGNWDDAQWARIENVAKEWHETGSLRFCCDGAMTPQKLTQVAKAEHRRAKGGLGGIVVDYMQLMRISDHKGNRETEVSEISRSLKSLAMSLDVPVIALSQLNRSLENRPNKRPMMSDLRESGSIEQDSDIILSIYRDEVYNKESKAKGFAELGILKQRDGELGVVLLEFKGEFGCFQNATRAYEGFEENDN